MEHETTEHWRDRLEIQVGMSKATALERLVEWRTTKKTCQRCEGEKYFDNCPMRLIREEADYVGDASRNGNRRRVVETARAETLRTQVPEKQKRASLRQAFDQEAGVSRRRPDALVSDSPNYQ